MKIEIGKTYVVSNKWKKSFIEREYFKPNNGDDDIVMYETGWRSGTWHITPTNEDEVEQLTDAMSEDWDDEFYPDSFEDTEFVESWDGCWDDWDFSGVTSKEGEELEAFEEEVMEEGNGWFFDNDWDSYDCEMFFQGPLNVELLESE